MSNISSADLEARKGSPSPRLDEGEFRRRFLNQFQDPAYEPLTPELTKISAAAWDAYKNSRKSPRTRKAGAEFADRTMISPPIGLMPAKPFTKPSAGTMIRTGQIDCSSSTAHPVASILVLAKSPRVFA